MGDEMPWPDWVSKDNIEWAARLSRLFRARPLVRYAGYLIVAAVATFSNAIQLLVVGVFQLFNTPLQVPETPPYIPVIFMALSVVLLIADRVLPEKSVFPTAYPHDEQLLRQVRGLLNPRVDSFVRNHAFGNGSFNYDILSPLHAMSEMQGSRCDFIDQQVNDAWRKVRAANSNFVHEVSLRTYPVRGNSSRVTPYHDNEDPDWHTPETVAKLKILDDAATALVTQIDTFDALSRRQIPNVV